MSEDKRLEIVSRDGMTFFAPVQEKGTKITGIRKWEQAFRVYAAIYSKAQPHRASEIWQYVYVINLASASYTWDNVAFYDYTFRQLMHQNPTRSWSKTYLQGWNLAMTDALSKGQNQASKGEGGHTSQKRDWKDDCCWKYNRNKCHKGNDCNWDHRCTYCGGWYHSFANCRKRLRKDGRGDKEHSRRDEGSKRKRSAPREAEQINSFYVVPLNICCIGCKLHFRFISSTSLF